MKDAIRITSVLIAAMVLLTLSPTAAEAVPPIPSSFYGTVKLNGSNVPDGTKVSAWIGGVKYTETETTTWGGNSVYSIDVPGDDPETPEKDGGVEGETIVFKIAGHTANQTGTWHSGTNVELNLTAAEGTVTVTPTSTFTPTPTNTPGRTPTPTPTSPRPTPTLTPTGTRTPVQPWFRIYLPLILKQPPAGLTISGRVTDNTGTSVSGAFVSATGPVNASTTTGSDGRYTLSDLPAGTYSVHIARAGYTSLPARNVTVPPNATNVDFVLYVLTFEFEGAAHSAAEGAFTKPIISLPGGVFTGPVVWTEGEGCTLSEIPPATSPNQIALVQRGNCLFLTKGQNAEARGYAGFVVANDADHGDGLIIMISYGGETIDIPGVFVGFSTGEVMKASSPNGILYARTLTNLGPLPDKFLFAFGSQGSGDGQFNSPTGVVVASSGTIYVADNLNHRIQYFSPTGQFLGKWGTYGSGDGEFDNALDVAVAPDGTVYVLDAENRRIQYFSPTGQFLGKWGTRGFGDGQFDFAPGVAVAPESMVYVTDCSDMPLDNPNRRIQRFSATGQFLGKWGTFGSGDGQFSCPVGVAVALDGTVYVTDGNRIQRFSATGQFLGKWGSYGGSDGQLSVPDGVTVAPDGTVYVAERGNARIQRFSATGQFLGKWGSRGSGDGQFVGPTDVAVAPDGTVYVADTYNYRIQAFGTARSNPWRGE